MSVIYKHCSEGHSRIGKTPEGRRVPMRLLAHVSVQKEDANPAYEACSLAPRLVLFQVRRAEPQQPAIFDQVRLQAAVLRLSRLAL